MQLSSWRCVLSVLLKSCFLIAANRSYSQEFHIGASDTSEQLPSGGCSKAAIYKIPHKKFFSKEHYSVYSFVFAAENSDLLPGVDYEAYWTIDCDRFPSRSKLVWHNPQGKVRNNIGVWGYHHVDFGNYDLSSQEIPVTPLQIKSIKNLIASFEWGYGGSPYFDVLTELWLTDIPHVQPRGNSGDALFEVGFLLYPGVDKNFALQDGDLVGYHVNGGITYLARKHQKYITFTKSDGSALLAGNINWKDALNFLIEKNVISGNEWVNGIGFGLEPMYQPGRGIISGQMTINKLSYTWEGMQH